MKTIGLIGGMSWESTLEYYRDINEGIKRELGGLNSAKILLYSFNFEEIEVLQHQNKWVELTEKMIKVALDLQEAGADMIAICTNTMHKMVPDIEASISIPVIHIADTVAKEIELRGLKKVALLGTEFTMTQDFYKGRIKDKFGIDVIVPNKYDRNLIHNIIYKELCLGNFSKDSKNKFIEIIEKIKIQGAEGVILGCTEIPFLIQDGDVSIPIFNTTKLHSEALVLESLKK